MDTLIADVRSGLRMLTSYPALSLVAVLTLGFGIGLSTTLFCVVNGGLWKGLPFPDAGRIVSLVSTTPSKQRPILPVSVQDLAVFHERQTSFEKVGAFWFAALNLSNEKGRPDRARVVRQHLTEVVCWRLRVRLGSCSASLACAGSSRHSRSTSRRSGSPSNSTTA